jgi:hypothetical protein
MAGKGTPAVPISALKKLIDYADQEGEIYIPTSFIRAHPEYTVGQAVVVFLNEELELGWTDIGRELGKAEGSVRNMYNRATDRAQEQAEKEDNDTPDGDPGHGKRIRPSESAQIEAEILC